MAKKYKVIALSVGGRNNKIYHSGDIVSEDNFPVGNIAGLVAGKFLKEISGVEAEKESDKDKKAKAAEAAAKAEQEAAADNTKTVNIDDIAVKDIKKQLTAAGIAFDKDLSKEELFALLPVL